MKKVLFALLSAVAFHIAFAATWTEPGTGYTYYYGSWWIGDGTVAIANRDDDEFYKAISPDPVGTLVIPSKIDGKIVSQLCDEAFEYCTKITGVVIPLSVTYIAETDYYWSGPFIGCTGITSVTMPSKYSLDYVFPSSPDIARVEIVSGETTICDNFAKGRTKIKSVIIPDTIVSVGNGAFVGCTGLGSGILTMNGCMFAVSSSDIETLQIGKTIRAISDDVSANCPKLKKIVLDSENTNFKLVDGILYSADGETLIACPKTVTTVSIPSTVKTICESAFLGCADIHKVTISPRFSLQTVFPTAYAKITDVNLIDDTNEISVRAFAGCAQLASITIPDCITEIGEYAFSGTHIEEFDLPVGLQVIRTGVFQGCVYLKTVKIPSTVTAIQTYAFAGCASLRSISIPESVKTIASVRIQGNSIIADGTPAFSRCSALTDVEMPTGFRLKYVFPDSNIRKFRFIGMPITIGDSMFEGCGGLSSIDIPASVSMIGNRAFANCASLKKVTFDGSAPSCGDNIFVGAASDLVVEVTQGSSGWTQWNGRALSYSAESGSAGGGAAAMTLTVTNVVINYVLNSVQPQFVLPATYDTGFVNIIAEVKGGCVAVPATWTVNYPKFTEKFGSDFTKALAMKTGKKDGAGNPMFVWQDYVAGTDPTDETDVFTASITIVDGKVKVSYTPELDDARKALRKYTTWGKEKLTDKDWSVVGEGEEGNFNFFKVTVEMK